KLSDFYEEIKKSHLNTFQIFYSWILKLYHKAGLHAKWLDTVRTSITIKRERGLCHNSLILYIVLKRIYFNTVRFITNILTAQIMRVSISLLHILMHRPVAHKRIRKN